MKQKLILRQRVFTQSQRGLTLAEIIVVITLISILAAVLFSSLGGSLSSGKEEITYTDIRNIENKIFIYTNKTKTRGKLPKSLSDLDGVNDTDPFGNKYIYSTSSSCGKKYEIVSMGADGKKGGDDDISSCDLDQ